MSIVNKRRGLYVTCVHEVSDIQVGDILLVKKMDIESVVLYDENGEHRISKKEFNNCMEL